MTQTLRKISGYMQSPGWHPFTYGLMSAQMICKQRNEYCRTLQRMSVLRRGIFKQHKPWPSSLDNNDLYFWNNDKNLIFVSVCPEPPPGSNPPSTTSSQQCLTSTKSSSTSCGSCKRWSIAGFARNVYGPLLERTPVKVQSHGYAMEFKYVLEPNKW